MTRLKGWQERRLLEPRLIPRTPVMLGFAHEVGDALQQGGGDDAVLDGVGEHGQSIDHLWLDTELREGRQRFDGEGHRLHIAVGVLPEDDGREIQSGKSFMAAHFEHGKPKLRLLKQCLGQIEVPETCMDSGFKTEKLHLVQPPARIAQPKSMLIKMSESLEIATEFYKGIDLVVMQKGLNLRIVATFQQCRALLQEQKLGFEISAVSSKDRLPYQRSSCSGVITEPKTTLEDLFKKIDSTLIVLLSAIQRCPDILQTKPEEVALRSGRVPLLCLVEMLEGLGQFVCHAQSVRELRIGSGLQIGMFLDGAALRHRLGGSHGDVAVLHHASRIFMPQWAVHLLEKLGWHVDTTSTAAPPDGGNSTPSDTGTNGDIGWQIDTNG